LVSLEGWRLRGAPGSPELQESYNEAMSAGQAPIDKAHWRVRIARQANMAQDEAEIGGHPGDFG